MRVSQGRCDTTQAERFVQPGCECRTYPTNLGPCENHVEGGNGRCVYCDHGLTCQPKNFTILERLLGKWRLWRGLCPNCNSDAPECDTCKVCYGFRGCPIPARIALWRARFGL